AVVPVDIDSKTVGTPVPVGNPGCSAASDVRPWAVKVQNGEVYAGVVCSEESVGSITAKFKAYVMKLSGGSFTTVASMPLNYEKDLSIMGTYTNKLACGAYHGWFPWVSNTSAFSGYAGCRPDQPKLTSHPQPILSDIEFDVDGSIILGFLDRFALQSGGENYAPGTSSTATYAGVAGGDIRRICNVNGGYVAEGGTGCAFNGGQDYSKKNEFYVGDNILYSWQGTSAAEPAHSETALGGLALRAGSGAVLTNVFDPIDDLTGSENRWGTGGVRWLSNTSGASQKNFEIISMSDSDFGKTAGLGDLELMCGPAPLEIGNRVWLDTNQNGVQDADESGLANVSVQLLSGATVLATVATASDGSYYFSNATGSSSGSRKYGVTQLQPGNTYTLKFPASVTVGGSTYGLTTTAAGANPQIDSNAGALGEVNVAASDIAVTGANNHSFDVGYTLVPEGCNLEGGGDGVASNNALGPTIVCAPTDTDLKLSKTVSPGTAQRGATVTYTLTLTNESELDATGVVVTDKLPVGVTYVTYATAAGAYDPGTGAWTVGAVAAGQSVTLAITVTVD
ncbi:SdrD B-like domain-containing protein, partial [Candidatus Thiothrix sp. Deng01]